MGTRKIQTVDILDVNTLDSTKPQIFTQRYDKHRRQFYLEFLPGNKQH